MQEVIYGGNADEVTARLRTLDKEVLIEGLVDIYQSLCCDERGLFSPAESTAADSSADFVDECNHMFQWLETHLQGDGK